MPVHVDMLVSGEGEPFQLSYRIFFNHEDEGLLNEVAERVRDCRFAYPPSLGTANNVAEARYVDFVNNAEVYKPDEEVAIHTVIPVSAIKRVYPQSGRRIYLEELVPAEFSEDRKIKRKEDYIYEGEGKPIKVLVNCEVFSCFIDGEKVAGVFM